MPFIGLTGGMGAGKTTALAALERLGAATISSDAVVHQLYEEPDVARAVVARWGEAVAPAGAVDRAAVAAKVFADPAERAWLESLLWPLVGQRVASFREAAQARVPAPRAVVVESPLLFEAGTEAVYDATIAIVADDDVRAARVRDRGQLALAERAARQLPQQEKADRSTFVVENSGALDELERRLSDVLVTLDGA